MTNVLALELAARPGGGIGCVWGLVAHGRGGVGGADPLLRTGVLHRLWALWIPRHSGAQLTKNTLSLAALFF